MVSGTYLNKKGTLFLCKSVCLLELPFLAPSYWLNLYILEIEMGIYYKGKEAIIKVKGAVIRGEKRDFSYL